MKPILLALFFAGLIPSALSQGNNPIVLLAKDARLKGELKYNLQYKNIGSWENIEGSATWDLKDVSPGMYNVQITYALKSTTAGRSFRMTTGAESKIVPIEEGTPGWFDFIQRDAGTIKISAQRTSFVIAAKEIPSGEALMNLLEVKLEKVPVGGNPVASGLPPKGTAPVISQPPAPPAGQPVPPAAPPTATPVASVILPPVDKETAPVGEWIWMDKTVLIVTPDGVAKREEKSGNLLVGKWSWDDKEKLMWHIDWNNGVTVSFTMTSDMHQMSGMNTLGGKVKTTRATAAAAIAAQETAAKEAAAAAKAAAKPATTLPATTKPPTSPTTTKPPSDVFGKPDPSSDFFFGEP